MSQRPACQTLDVDRSPVRYRSRRPDDAPIRTRLREIAAVRRRFGYRRLHILLRREGLQLNHKKLHSFPSRSGCRCAVAAAASEHSAPERRWPCRTGRTSAGRSISCTISSATAGALVILAVVDDFTRECLALVADTSLSGRRVGRELDAVVVKTWQARRLPLRQMAPN